MKKKILQLLQDASEQDPTSNSYEQRIIRDNYFEGIADKIELTIKELIDATEGLIAANKGNGKSVMRQIEIAQNAIHKLK